MSCRIVEKDEKVKFKPLVLEIDITSEDELAELYHRFGVGAILLEEITPSTFVKFPSAIGETYSSKIWNVICDACIRAGLRD